MKYYDRYVYANVVVKRTGFMENLHNKLYSDCTLMNPLIMNITYCSHIHIESLG